MSRLYFNIKYIEDTSSEEGRYKRLKAEYKDKQRFFIDLDLILKHRYPLKLLDAMLEDQKMELKYREELMKIFKKSLQKENQKCNGFDFKPKMT